MPATDGLGQLSLACHVPRFSALADGVAPEMSDGARDAVKESGGWTSMVQSYGGKAHDADSIEETRQIAEQMAANDAQDARDRK